MLKSCTCNVRKKKPLKSWYALITVAYSALNQTCEPLVLNAHGKVPVKCIKSEFKCLHCNIA